MFKKIEIWILYLTVLLFIPITIGFASIVRYEIRGGTRLGRFSKIALFLAEIPQNVINKEGSPLEVEDRFPLLDGFNGTPNLNESYLLLSRYDGDFKEALVELIDLRTFEVMHTWNPDIDEFNKLVNKVDEFKYLNRDANNSRYLLTHPILLKDGGLVFLNRFAPLRKIDSCSNLVFQNTHDIFHHSLETDLEGNIWVPSWKFPQSLSIKKVGRDIEQDGGYLEDAIVKLSPEGKILYEKSVSKIFIDNGLEYLLFSVGDPRFNQDPIHLNDIQPVNFDGDFWKKGDVFLSLRHQSMIFLYRPTTNKIIWKGTGPFFHQHDVDILNSHSISVFNNNSKNFASGGAVDGQNEVVIYDFKTNQYSPYLNKSLIENNVRTRTQGRSQILPNGDLLVEETNFGRTIYFNSDGSLRWTHVNRAKNNKVYTVAWSRILYNKKDLKTVKNFLSTRNKCDE